MRARVDSYSVTAKHYEGAYAAKQDLVDLPFYLELAVELSQRTVGPILEIACGTGRVLLPIARKGIDIHGVDNSQPMLKILRDRLAAEPNEVRRRVTLHEGDMRDFRLNAQYRLVIIPFRPMQHMLTVQDQVSALTTAASHLSETGILAFDVFYPKFEMLTARIGEEVPELEWTASSRTFRAGELILEETEPFQLSYFTYPHLRALFLLAGLEPVAEYGSFAKAPLDNNAEQMIFLLRKALPGRS